MAKKKRGKRPLLTSSVLEANDELRSKYGDAPITAGHSDTPETADSSNVSASYGDAPDAAHARRDHVDRIEEKACRRDAPDAPGDSGKRFADVSFDSQSDVVEFVPIEDEAGNGYDDYCEDYSDAEPSRTERAVTLMTQLLTMLLLGGSLVFWWVVLKYLLVSPYSLADPVQMESLLICCAILPVIIAAGQTGLHRPVDSERWLVCMCLSGALTTLFVVVLQTAIRDISTTFAEIPTLLCCAVSGCALPSALFYGARLLFVRVRAAFAQYRRADWLNVRQDVLELTDFDFLR